MYCQNVTNTCQTAFHKSEQVERVMLAGDDKTPPLAFFLAFLNVDYFFLSFILDLPYLPEVLCFEENRFPDSDRISFA